MKKNTKFVVAGALVAAVVGVGYVASNAQGMGPGMGRGMGMGMMHRGEMDHGMGKGHQMGMGQHGEGGNHRGNRVRHRVVRFDGLPPEYANLQSPPKTDAATIRAGKELFADNCASCHGEKGLGDGEAGKELNPKPANLAMIQGKWIATDGFYMWAISEGGEKLKTGMPAFKDALSENERWQIISYLKNGF